jgi:hypothetical protein
MKYEVALINGKSIVIEDSASADAMAEALASKGFYSTTRLVDSYGATQTAPITILERAVVHISPKD